MLPQFENSRRDFLIYLNFEEMMKDYDAIELHLSEDRNFGKSFFAHEKSLYYAFYGWDCDSILIMNPNIIKPIDLLLPMVIRNEVNYEETNKCY